MVNKVKYRGRLFSLYAQYIMRNARLEEAQAGIRLPGEISRTSDMQTPPFWQKVKRVVSAYLRFLIFLLAILFQLVLLPA